MILKEGCFQHVIIDHPAFIHVGINTMIKSCTVVPLFYMPALAPTFPQGAKRWRRYASSNRAAHVLTCFAGWLSGLYLRRHFASATSLTRRLGYLTQDCCVRDTTIQPHQTPRVRRGYNGRIERLESITHTHTPHHQSKKLQMMPNRCRVRGNKKSTCLIVAHLHPLPSDQWVWLSCARDSISALSL